MPKLHEVTFLNHRLKPRLSVTNLHSRHVGIAQQSIFFLSLLMVCFWVAYIRYTVYQTFVFEFLNLSLIVSRWALLRWCENLDFTYVYIFPYFLFLHPVFFPFFPAMFISLSLKSELALPVLSEQDK